jgi:hypothetical protein
MPHLIDELSQSLPPAVQAGVRESRYGGVDEDTQFTPPAPCPCGSSSRHHDQQVVMVEAALATSSALTVPGPAGPKPAAATVRQVDLEAALRSAHHCPPDGRPCVCETDEWDTDLRRTRDAVTAFLRRSGVGVDERTGDAWDAAPTESGRR